MTSELLAGLEASPSLRVEQRGPVAALYVRHRDEAIGTVDVRSGMLTVAVDHDLVAPLLDRHPQLQVTAGGVRLHATGAGRQTAEALVRWRMEVERFGPQLRSASP
jgi:hypothetical protein